MLGIFKKKEIQNLQGWQFGEIANQQPEEMMGLREYISVDSMKAHLVDMLEENRRLKAENEELRERSRKTDSDNRKKYELSAIEADEWKKRAKETEKEAQKLKQDLDRADHVVEKLQQKQNSLIAEAEMAKATLEKAANERRSARECRSWLERTLNSYGDWEEITKSQLISILKEAIKAKDQK